MTPFMITTYVFIRLLINYVTCVRTSIILRLDPKFGYKKTKEVRSLFPTYHIIRWKTMNRQVTVEECIVVVFDNYFYSNNRQLRKSTSRLPKKSFKEIALLDNSINGLALRRPYHFHFRLGFGVHLHLPKQEYSMLLYQ